MKNNEIKLYEDSNIRTIWDSDAEKWYISIVDVIAVLTESKRPRKYWSGLKSKLSKEGSQLSEKIGQLKMKYLDYQLRMKKRIHNSPLEMGYSW